MKGKRSVEKMKENNERKVSSYSRFLRKNFTRDIKTRFDGRAFHDFPEHILTSLTMRPGFTLARFVREEGMPYVENIQHCPFTREMLIFS